MSQNNNQQYSQETQRAVMIAIASNCIKIILIFFVCLKCLKAENGTRTDKSKPLKEKKEVFS